jgi:hypothetical protein
MSIVSGRRAPLVAGLALAVALGTPSGARGQEPGSSAVPRISNPATPPGGRQDVTLKELWRLGEGDGAIFGMVGSAFRDGQGNVCLLDNQACELSVYTPQGKLLRKMGRKGEGPGEFQTAVGACALPEGRFAVAQTFPGKLILFTADGTPDGTLEPQLGQAAGQSFLALIGIRPVGSNLAIVCMNQVFNQAEAKLSREHVLAVFDREGKLVHRLLQANEDLDLKQGFRMSERMTNRYQGRWTTAPDGTIYAAADVMGYEIQVFDPDGRAKAAIERDYKSVVRTAQEKKDMEELFAGFTRNAPQVTFTVEDTHADIQDVVLGHDGNLWVLPSDGRYRAPAGVMAVYDVFSPEGRFLHQVALHGEADPREDAITLDGDRVIVVRNFLSSVRALVADATKGEEKPAAEPAAAQGEEFDDGGFEEIEDEGAAAPAAKAAPAAEEPGVVIVCYAL